MVCIIEMGINRLLLILKGTKKWYQNGEYHRDFDRPAIIDADGSQEWWIHGQLHREGNQPAFICASEPQTYCRQGVPYQIQLKDFHSPRCSNHYGWNFWWGLCVFESITPNSLNF